MSPSDTLPLFSIIRLLLTLFLLALLPGWALLAMSGYWRKWEGLQRWFLAVCLGIAFWPVLYYLTRTFLPFMRLGFNKLILLLVFFVGVIVWKLRDYWRDQFRLGQWWWIVLIIMAFTFYSRFDLANASVYPGWTDSLHHTLLTDLTATTGKLPYNLLPYDAADLREYHLGLYALTAPVQLLANLPAHTALLWTAQFLNALCGVGIFLVLDRKVSRFAAIIGLVTACLFSFQPAQYFFWGRFTQLGAQTLLLAGGIVLWDVLESWQNAQNLKQKDIYFGAILGSLLLASLALIHFRVAGYTIPLTIIIFFAVITSEAKGEKRAINSLLAALFMVGVALLMVAPALLPALSGYLNPSQATDVVIVENMPNAYFGGNNLNTFYALGLPKWLSILSLFGALVGFINRRTRRLTVVIVLWSIALFLMGNLYRLGLWRLAFTNITAIHILAYLPAGLMAGVLAETVKDLVTETSAEKSNTYVFMLILIIFALGIWQSQKIKGQLITKDSWRFFMQESDKVAMDWITKNTPRESLFAVNTYIWLPQAAHGSDAGYWLPYFANRETTSGVMISNLREDYELVLNRDKWVLKLYDPQCSHDALESLCALGVDYLYSGAKDPFNGDDFDIHAIDELPGTELVYDRDGVSILQVCLP